jgi:hypothetical protein
LVVQGKSEDLLSVHEYQTVKQQVYFRLDFTNYSKIDILESEVEERENNLERLRTSFDNRQLQMSQLIEAEKVNLFTNVGDQYNLHFLTHMSESRPVLRVREEA